MTYEELLLECDTSNILVKEKPLLAHDGLWHKNKIAIRKNIPTLKEKKCVLAEELGHYHLTVGNILNQSNVKNKKQELRAREWGYDRLVGLEGIINAFNARCTTLCDMAEFLDITEEFLLESLNYYKRKYGLYKKVDNYIIYFEPCLSVMKIF